MPRASGRDAAQRIAEVFASIDSKTSSPSTFAADRTVARASARSLAGSTSVQYVFFYPDTNLYRSSRAAEGFVADPTERLLSV